VSAAHRIGSCRCGVVAPAVDVASDLGRTVTCDGSRCRRMEEALAELLFDRHAIRHRFCRTCGAESFAQGATPDWAKTAAINVNCLQGGNRGAQPSRQVHGGAC
jgi:hypothetical protein